MYKYCVGINNENCMITSVVLPMKAKPREMYDWPSTDRRFMFRITWK